MLYLIQKIVFTFRFAIFFIVLLSLSITLAQQPYFIQLGERDGLNAGPIFDLYMSKQGYLYLGTNSGLVRYDGTTFERLYCDAKGTSAVDDIIEDHNNQLWCKSFSNKVYSLLNDTLKEKVELSNQLEGNGNLKSLTQFQEEIVFVTENKIFSSSTHPHQTVLTAQKNDSIFHYLSDVYAVEDTLYVVDNIAVYKIIDNLISKQYTFIESKQYETYKLGGKMITVKKTDLSTLRINGVPQRDKLPIKEGYVNRITATNDIVWLCTSNGLIGFSDTDMPIYLFEKDKVTDVVKDQNGGLWVSTLNNGLYFIPSLEVLHHKLTSEKTTVVKRLEEDRYVVGTNSGSFIFFDGDFNVLKEIQSPTKSEVEYIYHDKNNNRLFTSHGVLSLVDDNHYFIMFGKDIAPDHRNNFVLPIYNSSLLIHQDLKSAPNSSLTKEREIVYYGGGTKAVTIRNHRAVCAHVDTIHHLYYVGYSDKLLVYDSLFNATEILVNDSIPVYALSFYPTAKGQVAVTTVHNGVLFVEQLSIVDQLSTRNGLTANGVIQFTEDERAYYVLTGKTLERIDKTTGEATNLASGFPHFMLKLFSFTLSNNEILVSSNKGILRFPKEQLDKINIPQIVSITGRAKTIPFEQLEASQIPFKYNDVRLKISSTHLMSFGAYEYAYRLKGYDEDWHVQPSNNNKINYLSLPPGSYTFEVRPVFLGHYGSTQTISFNIKPPFWLTWWFLTLCVVFLIALFLLLIKYFLIRIKKKQALKEKLLKSQLSALRAQMNPHFMFNVLNSSQGLIYANKKTEASNVLGQFAQLTRKILEYSDKQTIRLEQEIELLNLYVDLEKLRFNGELDYQFVHNLSSDELHMEIPSMIIQPFVENSIKHGLAHKLEDRKLLLSITKEKNTITVLIEDNGVGRTASAEINKKRVGHTSFATRSIDERIQLINSSKTTDITLATHDLYEGSEAKGTRVTLKLTLQDD